MKQKGISINREEMMSKSMSVILVILFLAVAGFAYLNYDRLNQIQDDLIEKEATLQDSEQLIKQQETAIAQMEEEIKEGQEKEKEKVLTEDNLMEDRDDEIQKQLKGYQAELQELRAKLEEYLQKDRIESQNIDQLKQEKSKLENLLEEKAEQWQSREMENKEIISSLQHEINEYKLDIESVNEKIVGLEAYLDTEISGRKNLEQEMNNYKENIATLQGKLTLEQNDEARVQEITQLQVNKKELEEEIEQRDSVLEQIQREYQLLQNQLSDYEEKIIDLQNEVMVIEEQKGILDEIQASLDQLKQEKSKLEVLLNEKESEWLDREEDSKQKIARLQTEVQEYESSLKEIGNDMLSLKQDITEKVTLKESLRDKIEHFTAEINDLKEEITHFQGIEESYQNTFNQLKSNMELLEKQFEEKGLEIEQSEYDELVDQLSLYQNQIEELKKDMAIAREKEDTVLAKQFTEMQQEIEILEQVLVEKENKWNRQNQENKELISSLKNQLADYQEEIEVVKVDSSLLKEEVAAQVELQQERMARIKDREEQILELTFQIEEYAKKIAEYEKRVNQLRVKLQQQENITYQEQQGIMDNLISLAAERDKIQDNINQYHAQINKLQSEIVELKDKIALMEKEEDRQFYEVRSGDCLWTIARDRYSEGIAWTKIFKANQGLIENPDLIYPYQQIILPE
jgi:chromosome segregation ATPase